MLVQRHTDRGSLPLISTPIYFCYNQSVRVLYFLLLIVSLVVHFGLCLLVWIALAMSTDGGNTFFINIGMPFFVLPFAILMVANTKLSWRAITKSHPRIILAVTYLLLPPLSLLIAIMLPFLLGMIWNFRSDTVLVSSFFILALSLVLTWRLYTKSKR
jgi:hypothetical protein